MGMLTDCIYCGDIACDCQPVETARVKEDLCECGAKRGGHDCKDTTQRDKYDAWGFLVDNDELIEEIVEEAVSCIWYQKGVTRFDRELLRKFLKSKLNDVKME